MGPQLIEHLRLGAVCYPVGFGKRISLHRVGHRQGESKGIDRQSLGGVGKLEGNLVCSLLGHRKLHVPGKAVGGNGVGRALELIGAVLQPADEGKQNGGPALPDVRVALPQVFLSVFGADRGQLRPQGINVHGEKIRLNGDHYG